MVRGRVTEGTSPRIISYEPARICSRLAKGAAAVLSMVAAPLSINSKGEPVIAGSPLLCCVARQMMGSEMPLIFW